MNTPSHVILNLVLLQQQIPVATPAIAWGAVLPDIPMFVMYLWAKVVRRQPEHEIWTKVYWSQFWQNWVALFHSIPLVVAIAFLAHQFHWLWVEVCCFSMLCHSLLDLPVHNDDAHRHLFPFSNFRFISPVSYWDPRHYGAIASLVEKLLVLGATLYLLPLIHSGWGRAGMVAVNLVYGSSLLYFRVIRRRTLTSTTERLELQKAEEGAVAPSSHSGMVN